MSGSGLSAVAAWDVSLLRTAVTTLGTVAERLVTWRARVEVIGSTLDAAELWHGEAARAAAGSLMRVCSVVGEVTTTLNDSLTDAELMVAAAAVATDAAGDALAAASAVPVPLDEQGRLGPLPEIPLGPAADPAAALEQQYAALAEQAEEARRAADLAAEGLRSAGRAAAAAGEAVATLGRAGVFAGALPANFVGLLEVVGLAGVSPWTPPPGGAGAVAAWWAALGHLQRLDYLATRFEDAGALEGLPAWARDRANRMLLAQVLADPGAPGRALAETTAREIARHQREGETVQLLQFAPEHDLIALAVGDLDAAEYIGVLVPGTGTTGADDLGALMTHAATVRDAGLAAAPAAAVATIAWIGYRTPPNVWKALSPGHAGAGGPALAGTLDGLAASRSTARVPAHVAVFAHSYGTQVVAEAAGAPGVLAADDVVLLGSPGMDGLAEDLEAPGVFHAVGPMDPILFVPLLPNVFDVPVLGTPVWSSAYGSTPLPVELDMGHSDYYDPDRPTLAALGEVLVDIR